MLTTVWLCRRFSAATGPLPDVPPIPKAAGTLLFNSDKEAISPSTRKHIIRRSDIIICRKHEQPVATGKQQYNNKIVIPLLLSEPVPDSSKKSQLSLTSTHRGMARLSWPSGWLVHPFTVLTGPDVEQLHWSRQTRSQRTTITKANCHKLN